MQVRKAERKLPWLRFADAQEKLKKSKEMLDKAQRRLAEVKAEVAQSVGPLKCAPLTPAAPCFVIARNKRGQAHRWAGCINAFIQLAVHCKAPHSG